MKKNVTIGRQKYSFFFTKTNDTQKDFAKGISYIK